MDGFVERVVNGKIFRNIASLVRRDNQSLQDPVVLGGTSNRGTVPRSDCGIPTSAGDLTFMSDHTTNKRKRKDIRTRNNGRPETAPNIVTKNSDASMVESFHLSPDQPPKIESNEGLSYAHVEPLPLTARYLKLFTFPGDDGEISTGLALTDTLVWNLNAVYQAKQKIGSYAAKIELVVEEVAEIHSLMAEFQQMIADSPQDQDQTSHYESIQEAEELLIEREQEMSRLQTKSHHWGCELEIPLSQVLASLHMVLESNDLIEDVLDGRDDGTTMESNHQLRSAVADQGFSLSPSEYARQEADDEGQEVFSTLQERRLNLQDAQARIDDWNNFYNQEYHQFQQLQSAGIFDGTKTDFDLDMVQKGQAATQDLIQAEKDLDEIVEYARLLRIEFEGFDQESGFVSQIEDGHIESMDPAEVYNVDSERIETWMYKTDEDTGESVVDVDDWECQSVGIFDSVSIVAAQVATGKERKRIDRWRSMCGLAEVERHEAGQEED
ncbi:uncharacterized protein RAG0_09585 [Rhynchosporium agropyri]|uniref:Uncharacterized protein n=1 Tax=Rhynchosporium agropyri TaxID=914238 RepID=A0A1E1KW44_9HELO|nr:uncharacterized protein RAG0_09585 [Rhynchosporium agropyri]